MNNVPGFGSEMDGEDKGGRQRVRRRLNATNFYRHGLVCLD